MSRPLPRYLNLSANDLAKIDKIIEATEGNTPTNPMQLANPADLRGIPCLAKGVGGTSPGTNPLTETINREHKRRYNR